MSSKMKVHLPYSGVGGGCPLVVVDLAISFQAQPEHVVLQYSRAQQVHELSQHDLLLGCKGPMLQLQERHLVAECPVATCRGALHMFVRTRGGMRYDQTQCTSG